MDGCPPAELRVARDQLVEYLKSKGIKIGWDGIKGDGQLHPALDEWDIAIECYGHSDLFDLYKDLPTKWKMALEPLYQSDKNGGKLFKVSLMSGSPLIPSIEREKEFDWDELYSDPNITDRRSSLSELKGPPCSKCCN